MCVQVLMVQTAHLESCGPDAESVVVTGTHLVLEATHVALLLFLESDSSQQAGQSQFKQPLRPNIFNFQMPESSGLSRIILGSSSNGLNTRLNKTALYFVTYSASLWKSKQKLEGCWVPEVTLLRGHLASSRAAPQPCSHWPDFSCSISVLNGNSIP